MPKTSDVRYPEVMSEEATLDMALGGTSIARFGDGEIRLMTGNSIPYNKYSEGLRDELCMIARTPRPEVLVCIPNIYKSYRKAWVEQYEQYGYLFPLPSYGSQFINRPDSAPWTDTDHFRSQVRRLWRGRHVTLVYGSETSLTPSMLDDVCSLKVVVGSKVDSYELIDNIEDEILETLPGIVIMCLGPTATCLAARLARRGVWAVDLGMIGKFINRTSDSPPLPR